jgi:hypothetical protein
VAIDASGAVYVVGTNAQDAFCRKLSSDGDELWTTTWASAEPDGAYGVALIDGGVVVVGQAQGTVDAPAATGSFVSRVTSAGAVMWTRYFSAPNAKFDAAMAVAASSDALYIAGQTWGALASDKNGGGSDAYLQKRSLDGNVLWTKQVVAPGTEEVSAIALGSDGTVVVAGRTTRAFPGFSTVLRDSAFVLRFAP